jgi:ABC-type Fe3+/spermidine/putrescine transport system ATPase subunit
VSREVASFIGRGAIVPAIDKGANAYVKIAGTTQRVRVQRANGARALFDKALVVLRPDALKLVAPTESVWVGRIVNRRFAGGVEVYRVQLQDDIAVEVESRATDRREDDTVGVEPLDSPVAIIPG